MEVYIDDETKLTLHGLKQHYCKLRDNEKNRKLFDLLDALEFNQVCNQLELFWCLIYYILLYCYIHKSWVSISIDNLPKRFTQNGAQCIRVHLLFPRLLWILMRDSLQTFDNMNGMQIFCLQVKPDVHFDTAVTKLSILPSTNIISMTYLCVSKAMILLIECFECSWSQQFNCLERCLKVY